MLTDTGKSPRAVLRGLPYQAVEWTEGLYRERFETCAAATVPHLQKMFEDRNISHVLENFKIAAGEAEGAFDGTVFGDGDFYKWMEAAVYTAVRTRNEALLEQLESYIGLIGRAQQEDGYLSTKQIIGERNGTACRLGDINDFEVYNFGHLFTSACLYRRLTGKDSFLQIAERAAGYLKKLYEAAQKSGEVQTAVCPSHYMGLAELYRTTGKGEYLKLLKTAISLRDSVQEGLDDNQDRLPLREHDRIIGHAVRANYLYAGVADLCMEEEQPELEEVLHKVWNSLVNQKLYITGGCGALYNGASPYGNFFHHQLVHQAYGYEYQLPNVTAYNETCASVGGVYWAWRMLCREKRTEYADVMERMMLNVNLAAVSMDGKRFFYENMLRRAKKLPYELVWGQERAEYILSYCCPPNLARLIAESSEYAYAMDENGSIYTVLYGASSLRTETEGLGSFRLIQDTAYPYDGVIRFSVCDYKEAEGGRRKPLSVHLRIPSWVRQGSVKLLDKEGKLLKELTLGRKEAGNWLQAALGTQEPMPENVLCCAEAPDKVELLLDLGMRPRLTCAHPLVEENTNQVAVEYGPLVYCLESMDAPVETLDELLMPARAELYPLEMELAGRNIVALEGSMVRRKEPAEDRDALYCEYVEGEYEPVKVRLIPYFAWDNRGPGEMKVWLPLKHGGDCLC